MYDYSKGRIDVEMIFMEALRKTDFNFFAVDIKILGMVGLTQ